MFGTAFTNCVGCSTKIVEGYREAPHDFVLKACNEPEFLENIAGITGMMKDFNIDDIECFDDFDDALSNEES
jgi:hypothetical protein